MSLYDEIHVSQILYCNNGEPVVVVSKTAKTITLEYKNQLHIRSLSVIGEKLHVNPPMQKYKSIQNPNSANKSLLVSNISQGESSPKHSCSQQNQYDYKDTPSCFQCMLQARDDCFGMPYGICEKFVRKPEISDDKRKNWPKYGDASAYRFGEHRDD